MTTKSKNILLFIRCELNHLGQWIHPGQVKATIIRIERDINQVFDQDRQANRQDVARVRAILRDLIYHPSLIKLVETARHHDRFMSNEKVINTLVGVYQQSGKRSLCWDDCKSMYFCARPAKPNHRKHRAWTGLAWT